MSARRLPAALVRTESRSRAAQGVRSAPFIASARPRLVIVGAALQHGDRRRPDMAQHQPAGMAGDAGLRESPAGRRRECVATPRTSSAKSPRPEPSTTRDARPRSPAARADPDAVSPASCAALRAQIVRRRRTAAATAPSVTVRRTPSGPQRWTGISSLRESAQPLAAAAAGRDQRPRPAPTTTHSTMRRSPAPTMAAMAEASAHSLADRRRSRHCSRHRSCRPRRAARRRPGISNRAHRRASSRCAPACDHVLVGASQCSFT